MTLLFYKVGKNNFKSYIITSQFFPHIIAIDINLICQDKFCSEKQGISVIFGFFQDFLALFDTFTTRYRHLGIKFEIFDSFWSIKPLKSNINFENFEKQLKMPFRPLWAPTLCAFWDLKKICYMKYVLVRL